jgi:AbrB family looped-hinge helix DNA binding protein
MRASHRQSFEATLRPRRQITLPGQVCEALGIDVGDRVELELREDGVYMRPKRALALDALREIQRAFATTGIDEEELGKELHRAREQSSRSRYGEP